MRNKRYFATSSKLKTDKQSNLLKKLHIYNITHTPTNDTATLARVLETEDIKELSRDNEKLDKAISGLNNLSDGKNLEGREAISFFGIKKKYKKHFHDNRDQLDNATSDDVNEMDINSLREIKEMINESLSYRHTRQNIQGSNTPTSDFIDELPRDYSPFDDMDD